MKSTKLTKGEIKRYARQIILPEISFEGQEKLKEARVLIIGLGGLGSVVALYLTASGIGKLGLIDTDEVDLVNLHRQILYNEDDIGKKKAMVAKQKLLSLNSNSEIDAYSEKFSPINALSLVEQYDFVADCSDNFPTRYLVNDACVLKGKTFIHGAIYKFEGHLSVLNYKNGPCYRCLFPELPTSDSFQNCDTLGIIGTLTGLIGCLQANEIIKLVLQIGKILAGKLLYFDALNIAYKQFEIKKNLDCAICGSNPIIRSLTESNYLI